MTIGILGATGYTGRLVTDYFVKHNDGHDYILAARSPTKLDEVRKELKVPSSIKSVQCNVNDAASLDAFVKQCRVVVNCVGPFRLYGEQVIQAALKHGRQYCDVDGEPDFILKMCRKYHEEAVEKNVCICLAAGFDCVPADLGVRFASEPFDPNHSLTIRGSVHFHGMDNTLSSGSLFKNVSHGTFYTLLESLKGGSPLKRQAGRAHVDEGGSSGRPHGHVDVLARQRSKAPFAYFDAFRQRWLMRFPVADPHAVRRTCQVLGQRNLKYDHYLELDSIFALVYFVLVFVCLKVLVSFGPTFKWLKSLKKEGEGPSAEQLGKVRFTMTFDATGTLRGEVPQAQEPDMQEPTTVNRVRPSRSGNTTTYYSVVSGPESYLATAIFAGEIAKVLSLGPESGLEMRGGVGTPGCVMHAEAYIQRLENRGIKFVRL
jgi:short subunit dehydrogenase-like uncharacterized protein